MQSSDTDCRASIIHLINECTLNETEELGMIITLFVFSLRGWYTEYMREHRGMRCLVVVDDRA